MKPRFIAVFVALSVLTTPLSALAATGSSTDGARYFIQTNKSFWRNTLGARNVFPTGFTADLSDFQYRVAKFAGLKPIAVKRFTILDDSAASPSPTSQETPADPLPWGIKYILGTSANHTSGGKGVTVAVLDTGVDANHSDLKDRITECADYADLSAALIEKECHDANGHGTHMAGIVAADGGSDGKGIWGLAPQADLAIYKVCNDQGLCLSDDIAKATEAAVDDGANIIVLGLGGEAASSFIDDALQYAADHQVLVVAAAGNNGPYEDSLDWPAHNPLTVAVGALATDGTVADFSSRGGIEVVAPGENIESTFLDDSYAILSGTSMAAPHIAGLAARIWQSKAEKPADATRELLRTMAHDIAPVGSDASSGWGSPRY